MSIDEHMITCRDCEAENWIIGRDVADNVEVSCSRCGKSLGRVSDSRAEMKVSRTFYRYKAPVAGLNQFRKNLSA